MSLVLSIASSMVIELSSFLLLNEVSFSPSFSDVLFCAMPLFFELGFKRSFALFSSINNSSCSLWVEVLTLFSSFEFEATAV